MARAELVDFIQKRLAQGASKTEISTQLVTQGGWQAPDVEEAFQVAQGGQDKPKEPVRLSEDNIQDQNTLSQDTAAEPFHTESTQRVSQSMEPQEKTGEKPGESFTRMSPDKMELKFSKQPKKEKDTDTETHDDAGHPQSVEQSQTPPSKETQKEPPMQGFQVQRPPKPNGEPKATSTAESIRPQRDPIDLSDALERKSSLAPHMQKSGGGHRWLGVFVVLLVLILAGAGVAFAHLNGYINIPFSVPSFWGEEKTPEEVLGQALYNAQTINYETITADFDFDGTLDMGMVKDMAGTVDVQEASQQEASQQATTSESVNILADTSFKLPFASILTAFPGIRLAQSSGGEAEAEALSVSADENHLEWRLRGTVVADAINKDFIKNSVLFDLQSLVQAGPFSINLPIAGEYRNVSPTEKYYKLTALPDLSVFGIDAGKVKDTWVKFDTAEFEDLAEEQGADVSFTDIQKEEIKNIFNRLVQEGISISEVKNNQKISGVSVYAYTLGFNGNVLVQTMEDLEQVIESPETKGESDAPRSEEEKETLASLFSGATLDIRIGKKDLQIYDLRFHMPVDFADDELQITGDINLGMSVKDYDAPVFVSVPVGAVTFDEFMQRFTNVSAKTVE